MQSLVTVSRHLTSPWAKTKKKIKNLPLKNLRKIVDWSNVIFLILIFAVRTCLKICSPTLWLIMNMLSVYCLRIRGPRWPCIAHNRLRLPGGVISPFGSGVEVQNRCQDSSNGSYLKYLIRTILAFFLSMSL